MLVSPDRVHAQLVCLSVQMEGVCGVCSRLPKDRQGSEAEGPLTEETFVEPWQRIGVWKMGGKPGLGSVRNCSL